MNFLAHLHLSGIDDELLLLGNFMGDFVKGSHLEKYPRSVQKGIILHRHIDQFTDGHRAIHEVKQIFRPLYGRYSGVVTDIILDHFLSSHWQQFSNYDRLWFVSNFYTILQKHIRLLPTDLQKLVPSLIYNDWVLCYASFYGTGKVLNRMSKRTTLPNHTQDAINLMRCNYLQIDALFLEFYPEVMLSCKSIEI